MSQASSSNPDDQFFDALDQFPPSDEDEDSSSNLSSTVDDEVTSESQDTSINLHRRSNEPSSSNSTIFQGISHKEKRIKILNALKECGNQENSNSNSELDFNLNLENTNSSSFLVNLAGLVIKAIGYQIYILVNFVSFPIWIMYGSFLFMIDPCKTMKRAKNGVLERFNSVWNVFSEGIAPFLLDKLKGQKSVGKLALKFGWGFVCSMYICFLLVGLLVTGFVIGGFTMRYLVEEPIEVTESLNFDYTRDSPVALVPIMSCPSSYSGVKYHDFVEKSSGRRVLPTNQNLQLTISLLVPESNYNQNLGVFQVRVDFLSENGEVTATSRLPCMLKFKSHLIRYLETFLKSIPLLAGYASESQILHIKMRGFTEEAYRPTSCLRVVLEQRAEYRSGAGIPEIYTASILLESELPFLKRIIWFWRKTIFVWISLVTFTMELMMVLICCRPFSALGTRPGGSSTASSGIRNNVANTVRS